MNYEVISVIKSPSLTQGEDKEVSGELNGNSPRFPKDGFPPLSEQGDNFVRSNDIRKYARGKHTQLNIGWKVRPKYGLGCTTNVRMVIQLAKDLEWTIAHSLQSNRVARSFEFTRHSSIVGIPVENNTGTKEWTKMARSIMISRIIKRWWNSHHILDKKRW